MSELEQIAERFPIGADVLYFPLQGSFDFEATKIRSIPWALGHGDIIIKVEGRAGGVAIGHIRPSPTPPTPTVQEGDETIETLDERMIAAGMIPLSKLLAGGLPLEKFSVHAGMDSIEFFQVWINRNHEQYMKMRMRYELGDKPKDDDMYEWVFAHSAVYGTVAENLRAALSNGEQESGT